MNELIDSLTNENVDEVKEQLTSETSALNETNSQLYSRAKKAEGFEKGKDGKWIKKEIKSKPVVETEDKKIIKKPDEIDYGQKTFISQILKVDLGDEKQMALISDYRDNGKSLDDLAVNKHFQNDLKDIKTAQSVKDATPSSNKRSAGSSGKAVDYWLKKYQDGTPLQDVPKDLRTEVLNTRLSKDEKKSHFS